MTGKLTTTPFSASPRLAGPGGWRLEGHHLSLNFTIRDGKLVSATPAFFGANPHEVRRGADKGLRVLGAEEDKAKQLLQSLESRQRDLAVVQHVAYRDILSFVDQRARLVNEPPGLAAAELTDGQYQALRSLVHEYAANGSAAITKGRMDRFDGTAREKIHFAWAGGTKPGEGVYYRVQTPHFLIEYANTQNRANHSHTVWRDWNGDFGHDVLAAHYQDYDQRAPRAGLQGGEIAPPGIWEREGKFLAPRGPGRHRIDLPSLREQE